MRRNGQLTGRRLLGAACAILVIGSSAFAGGLEDAVEPLQSASPRVDDGGLYSSAPVERSATQSVGEPAPQTGGGATSPGSPNYPNGGMQRLPMFAGRGERYAGTGIADPAGQFGYFGTFSDPAYITKVNLTTGTRVDAIQLELPVSGIVSATVDPNGEYAYFGTATEPGYVEKVRLSDFKSVGRLAFEPGEQNLRDAAMDPAGQYAYFVTRTTPVKLVRVDLATFTREDVLTLNAGESLSRGVVVDPSGSFAYIGCETSPGIVVKVDLATFTRVSAVTTTGVNALTRGDIHPAGTHVFFVGGSTIAKVALDPFAFAGPIATTGSFLNHIAIPRTGNFGYAATSLDPAKFHKVDLDGGTETASVTFSAGQQWPRASVFDAAQTHLFTALQTDPMQIHRVSLDPLARVGGFSCPVADTAYTDGAISPDGAYLYAVQYRSPTIVARIDRTTGEILNRLTLASDEEYARSIAVTPDGAFAYVGARTQSDQSAKIVKIDLSTFTRVGRLTIPVESQVSYGGVIDSAGRYAYFARGTSTGRVGKIDLGTFTLDSTLTLPTGEDSVTLLALNRAGDTLYAPAAGGKLVRIDTATMTRTDSVTLATAGLARDLELSPDGTYALVLADSRIHKVTLEPFAYSKSLSLTPYFPYGGELIFEAEGNFAYVMSDIDTANGSDFAGEVLKVDLRTFTGVAMLQLLDFESDPSEGILGPDGVANWVSSRAPGRVVRTLPSQRGAIKGARIVVNEPSRVDSVQFYSHQGTGNVRLAIYTSDPLPELEWQSVPIQNSTTEGWITVPTSEGTPSTLELEAGNYWLVGQVDTAEPVASRLDAAPGEGIFFLGDFNAGMPATAPTGYETTAEAWATDISLTPLPASPEHWLVY